MGDVSAEPSMEDILSSIKRIIAEDGASEAGQAAARTRRPSRAATTVSSVRPAVPSTDDADGVLELNEPAPAAEPESTGDPLVSPTAVEASRGSLDALTRMIAQPNAEAAPAAVGQTMDAFVAELLRPLLREWLDANLPEVVERMVAKEIARITGNR